jgi:hypothetical protein
VARQNLRKICPDRYGTARQISVTFVPLAVADGKQSLVAVALLIQSVTAPPARWLAGRFR